jgi:hypothetical protein
VNSLTDYSPSKISADDKAMFMFVKKDNASTLQALYSLSSK